MKNNRSTLENLREDYQKDCLQIADVAKSPIVQFDYWFQDALNAKVSEPNAMIIATVKDGKPSARVVLLKGFDENGFTFYTNYESKKAQDLAQNPHTALVFNWLDLQRQIRIEGTVEKISKEQSAAYFHKRPKKSQIGAWASPQSRVISDRKILEKNVKNLTKKYEHAEQLPLPDFWGGYRVQPQRIEFWQGRSSRLHDRIVYQKQENEWIIERLAP